MKKIYLLIWAFPLVFSCLLGYNMINAAWIYVYSIGKIARLNGYMYLLTSLLYLLYLIVSAIIALALILYLHHKHRS